MSALRRVSAVPAGLAVLAFAMAFGQEPGKLSFDTKAQLHLAPGRFLADILSVWTPSTDLGHVWAGQYVGYAFPMGPFFAAGHLVGLPDWIVERLWLGALLAVAAWGAVRLLDALLDRPRGLAHVVAGAALVANPYVAVLANRASVTLIAYALLPWLLLTAHRGVRAPRSWWWPAATALLVAATAPGVNAAVTAWVLVGPLLLALYEPLLGEVRWRAVWSFGWRCGVLGVLASLWWVIPAVIQAAHGLNFLTFVEQPGTVWGTTSASEALRLMGYWHSYTGVGLSGRSVPLLSTSPPLLFSRPVVLAGLLIPAAALASFVWTRRWRYGPFCVLLVLVGVGITMAGFPEGTPLRHGLYFVYNRVAPIQFLRTSQKAAPLIAVGLALLLGTGVAEAARRWRWRLAAPVLGAGAAVLLALAAWPLTRGDAIGLTSKGVPAAWTAVARDVDRSLPSNTRAVVLPGQLFGFYRWGGVGDPILPAITTRPVAVRAIVPYADLHAMDALWTVDRLVGQQRLYPGELQPMLGLLGAGWVVTGTDDDRNLSGGPDPVRAAGTLAAQGLGVPTAAYGPRRSFAAPPDRAGGSVRLPQVRRYALPPGRGIVRVEPAAQPTIVDGSAEALGELASFGALAPHRLIRYAADVPAAALRVAAAAGADVVVTDANRRRVFANSRPRQNLGYTLALGDPISADSAQLDPFSGRADAQTIAVLSGARYVRAPYSPALSLFPEHRPFAAFDGDPHTAWIADRALDPARRWIEIGFDAPRDVPTVDVVPADDQRGIIRQVVIAGRTFAVHPGHNVLRLDLHHVSALRIAIPHVSYPPHVNGGAGGLYEVGIPGVHVSEALRLPVVAERALAGANLRRDNLTYLFARTTGDDPRHRARAHGPWQADSTRNAGDAETSWHRLLAPPAARRWTAGAWLSLSPLAPDDLLDRLAGYRGPVDATSSGRFANTGAYRASSAFDGDPRRPWIGERVDGNRPWLAWRLPRAVTIRRLTLQTPPSRGLATPALVSLSWPGGSTGGLPVAADGSVALPAPARARAFRLTVLRSRFGSPAARRRRAVAIGELRGAGVPRMVIRRRGALPASCGAAAVRTAAGPLQLALRSTIQALDGARALRAAGCGPALSLPAGSQRLDVPDGPFRVDALRLTSAAPVPVVTGAGDSGRVVAPGTIHRASVTGVRVAVDRPSWLVLAESFDRGWRATCDGRSLGTPVVVDGFANGWPVAPGCRAVSFAYAPQHTALLAEIVSGLSTLALLVLLVIRRAPVPARDPAPDPARGEPAAGRRPRRVALPRAAACALAAGVVLGFVLSIRAGVAIAVGTTLVLWLGIGARRLTLAAAALLTVGVPAAYLLTGVHNHGGWDFNYPVERIDGHWLAVAALVLLLGAVVRAMAEHRGSIAERS